MRALLIGDGQVCLFQDVDALCRSVEWQEAESEIFRAFLEDGTEYKISVAQGAYVKDAFNNTSQWIEDFKYTAATDIFKKDDEYLKCAIVDWLMRTRSYSPNINDESLKSLVDTLETIDGFHN